MDNLQKIYLALIKQQSNDLYNTIYQIASEVRQQITNKYGIQLQGHAIEACDMLVQRLRAAGFEDVTSPEGYVIFSEQNGMQIPYTQHTWVQCGGYFVDVTIDSYNELLDEDLYEFPPVCVYKDLPRCITLTQPELNDQGFIIKTDYGQWE